MFIGFEAGQGNTTGIHNTILGYQAGFSNTTGLENSFFGYQAGRDNTTGLGNTFIGGGAGDGNDTGSENTFLGYQAGRNNSTGNNNSFVGQRAGFYNSAGSNNTLIGYAADVPSSSSNLTFATAIGSGAIVSTSNTVVLGRSADAVKIPGKISGRLVVHDTSNSGIRVFTDIVGGTVASFGGNGEFNIDAPGVAAGRLHIKENGNVGINVPGANVNNKLDVNGTVGVWTLGSAGSTALCWHTVSYAISTCSSSLRYKTNVAPFGFGMDLVKKLRPIAYNWKHDGAFDLGFGAEDIARIDPRFVTFNAQGEVEGVKYDRMSVVFVNAFKEQQAQIESQKKEIQALKTKVAEIEAQQKQIEELRAKAIQMGELKRLVCAQNKEATVCKEEK